MSCWVVPTLAAELWGVPLEQILSEIRAGVIPSKLDHGFRVVDVSPDSRTCQTKSRRRRKTPPRTYVSAETLAQASDAVDAISAESFGVMGSATLPGQPGVAAACDVPAPSVPDAADYLSSAAKVISVTSLSAVSEIPTPVMVLEPAGLPADLPAAGDSQLDPAELVALSAALPATDATLAAVEAAATPTAPFAPSPLSRTRDSYTEESEDGPDPNDGEVDDGKPLDWRAARMQAASRRRRPPTRFN